MEILTIQNHRPPIDPADFVANGVVLAGSDRGTRNDAENDQMQVGARLFRS